MSPFRLVLLLSLCCFLGAAQELSSIPTEHPEQIGGRWEAATASGVEGIGFEILTSSMGKIGSDAERFNWQTINIRVYTREGGKETWGYFAAQHKATPKSYDELLDGHSFDLFDGRRLRVHSVEVDGLKQFDLDVTFVPAKNKWMGSWSRPGKNEEVTLVRPEPTGIVKVHPLVGEWIGERAPNSTFPFEPTTLIIRQSPDGVISVWMERTFSWIDGRTGVTQNERRNGDQLTIESITETALVLSTNSPGGPPYKFHGSLSPDGHILIGNWDSQGGGGTLNVANQFRKLLSVQLRNWHPPNWSP